MSPLFARLSAMRSNLSIILLLVLATGCATSRKSLEPKPETAQLFPQEALVTQRGILTILGRQYTLNGYVAKSATHGLRLIMMENFGTVFADVLVKPDGKVFVMQAKSPFQPEWVERFIAADLKCIFSDTMETNCPMQMLSPTHFFIKRRWYKLDLQTVEVKAGEQPVTMFDESTALKP
jgi:hypothetical protein